MSEPDTPQLTPLTSYRKRRASVSVDDLRYSLIENPPISPFALLLTKKLSLDPNASFNADIDCEPEAPPSVITTEWDSWVLSLPPNILLNVRLHPYNSLTAKLYPMAKLGYSKRFYYPDYKCLENLVDGIVKEFSLPSRAAIKSFKMCAKLRGEVVVDREVAGEGPWEALMREIRVKRVARLDPGIRCSTSARLVVNLETTTN
ncbi:hypothetical protein RUND412_007390 [Rhizina undulata]